MDDHFSNQGQRDILKDNQSNTYKLTTECCCLSLGTFDWEIQENVSRRSKLLFPAELQGVNEQSVRFWYRNMAAEQLEKPAKVLEVANSGQSLEIFQH